MVHAVTELLVDRGERATIVNGEMGCGKTTVSIRHAAVLNAEGYRRTLVLSPHLVYLVAARNPGDGGRCQGLGAQRPGHWSSAETARAVGRAGAGPGVSPGRAMRMGFHWKPSSFGGALFTATTGPARIAGMSSPTWTASLINPVELEAEESCRKQPLPSPLWSLIRPRGNPPATSPRRCSRHCRIPDHRAKSPRRS